MCGMTHLHVWHESFTCVTWHIYTCDMNNSRVWQDWFTRATWLIYKCENHFTCNTTHLHVWHDLFHVSDDSFSCHVPRHMRMSHQNTTWLIRMCDMTHSYLWHDSFISCVRWLILMWRATKTPQSAQSLKTHSYVWHDSFICVTWLVHARDIFLLSDMQHDSKKNDLPMTHSYVWCDSETAHVPTWLIICVTWLVKMRDMNYFFQFLCNLRRDSEQAHTPIRHVFFSPLVYECVTWLIYTRDMTHLHKRHGTKPSLTCHSLTCKGPFASDMWVSALCTHSLTCHSRTCHTCPFAFSSRL